MHKKSSQWKWGNKNDRKFTKKEGKKEGNSDELKSDKNQNFPQFLEGWKPLNLYLPANQNLHKRNYG